MKRGEDTGHVSTVRQARLRAILVGAIGAVALACWLAIAPRVQAAAYDGGWPGSAALLPCLAVSVLLCARLPGAAVTRVITAFTLCSAILLLNEAAALWPYLGSGQSPPADVVGPLGSIGVALWVGTLPLLPVLLVVFPDGVPTSRFWRTVLTVQLAAIAVAVPVLVDQGDGHVSTLLSGVGVVAGLALLASGLVRAAALIRQWWGSRGERRRQLTPFVGTAAALALFYASTGAYMAITGRGELGNGLVSGVLFALVLASLPCAIGASVLRHHLFGVEIAVNRAAAATLRSLAASLGETVDPWELPQVIVRTIAEALRLPFVALDRGTSPSSPPARLAVIGQEPGPERVSRFDITFGGDRLAQLSVSARAGERTLTASDRGLLSDLASQAGPALYASRLVDELTESRERLRHSRIEERAKLSRALHDSISPTLSGIAIAAAAGQLRPTTDPAIPALLGRIEHEAGAGALTLKALLAGLRPPGLDEVGLVPAIEHRAADIAAVASLHFEIDATEPLPPLGTAVEEAAYLITVEAMANAARHAHARQCRVQISGVDGQLRIAIIDDGCGPGPAHRDGQGLRSARERTQACGGSLVFGPQTEGGSGVLVTLPTWRKS
jgi:two-component system, NarL family, sensor kinase